MPDDIENTGLSPGSPEKTQSPKEKLKEITDGIERGIKELFASDRYADYLKTMSRFHNYSLNNIMLIYMQKPNATMVAGFGKWKDHFVELHMLQYFEKYIESGYYPFYREEGDGFPDRLQQVIDTVVTSEIPAVSHIEYDSVYKVKQLLAILAETKPYTLNISSLCTTLQSSRNNVLKLLDLMDKAALIRRLYATESGMNMLTKPEKILFYNTNLMYCLTPQVDSGTMRETYLASQVSVNHRLYMPNKGDLVVDGKWLFEVGGKGKNFSQIKNIENSFVVSDNMEIGYGNKIPLWLFGLLY